MALRALLLLDIDGVLRDVAGSYRRAIADTVEHYSGWRPDARAIDALKAEGLWNNDWRAAEELLHRRRKAAGGFALPPFAALVEVFSGFYFGGDPAADPLTWHGHIRDEPLLVTTDFFHQLSAAGIGWGFVSGAEPSSARFVLERRLELVLPPLLAMGDAPDKPDPTGFLQLAEQLAQAGDRPLTRLPVAYIGDTVADVMTVVRARQVRPELSLKALAVLPPHVARAEPA
ncbi:MAG: TIGR01548 family HAD-type hydrolase, partial [Aphanocapsa feldmannii 288cV]